MRKLVVILNGAGGAGKDTVCAIAARAYAVKVLSSIDPIKEIAARGGWDPADKSLPARKLLSDLKRAFSAYNDLPNRYLMDGYRAFLDSGAEILFAHIREPEEIEDFRTRIRNAPRSVRCVTLLVKAAWARAGSYGNRSDDEVERYPYDFVYRNDKPMEELPEDFLRFFSDSVLSGGNIGGDSESGKDETV